MKVISTISNNNDWYLLSADFPAYIEEQEKVNISLIFRSIKFGKILTNGLKCQFTMVSELENSAVTELSKSMLKKSGKSLHVKLLNRLISVVKGLETPIVLLIPTTE